ncbi:hypothetical protein NDU88_010658 [Pleurodeles waltl]|uniref:Uncharacterized protein n=1 Tax=Pleurodeles waltl TaxID=8319 RepID=A0AAV7RZX5_PLEWA|nr:hypothetical protein NDU88_010658 [Pleurodeles waltl]
MPRPPRPRRPKPGAPGDQALMPLVPISPGVPLHGAAPAPVGLCSPSRLNAFHNGIPDLTRRHTQKHRRALKHYKLLTMASVMSTDD